jgi:hypothetical protein
VENWSKSICKIDCGHAMVAMISVCIREHRLVAAMNLFWSSEKLPVLELTTWIARACKHVKTRYMQFGMEIGRQFLIVSRPPFLWNRIIPAFFHEVTTRSLLIFALINSCIKLRPSFPAAFMIRSLMPSLPHGLRCSFRWASRISFPFFAFGDLRVENERWSHQSLDTINL